MTIEEKRRELFEDRERDRDRIISAKYCGQYTSEKQQERWLDWNAALDSIVVELPPTITADDMSDAFGLDDFDAQDCADTVNGAIASCAAFIHAAGVSTK